MVDARFPEAQIDAARRARASGSLVMLDCGHPRRGVDELLSLSDVAIFPVTYMHATQRHAREAADFVAWLSARLAPEGRRLAGLTLGERGCWIAAGDEEPVHVPALPVEAMDTTGAGDVFHGAFLHDLLRGASPAGAARFAGAAAALSCLALTGRAPLPPEDEIRRHASRL
jgi:sugar/nucleoside kinase (ribokinase family)